MKILAYAYLALVVVAAVSAGFWAPTRQAGEQALLSSPHVQDKGFPAFQPPSSRHPLGTDHARRDVLARMLHGARIEIAFGPLTVAIAVALGLTMGLLAGWYGGLVDTLFSYCASTVLSIPAFFLFLVVSSLNEQPSVLLLAGALGFVMWPKIFRVVRADVSKARHMGFVVAAKTLGTPVGRIFLRHILPQVLPPVIVLACFGLATATLAQSALSFLGVGIPDHLPSWGGLIAGALGHLHAWWLIVYPAAGIFLLVLSYNILGETLRQALDPATNGPSERSH